tara:strand:+ start:50 stop:196 length:147 start_codon:yes stop_codon:yes gene_type:complete
MKIKLKKIFMTSAPVSLEFIIIVYLILLVASITVNVYQFKLINRILGD